MSDCEYGETVFGIKKVRELSLTMCGGCREWWNYIIRFDKDGGIDLYREDLEGLHHITRNPDCILFNYETEQLIFERYEGMNESEWVNVNEDFYDNFVI
jgi:hypothetical protein